MPMISPGTPKGGRLGVFGDNRKRPFHRWYPFVEGYSSELVERALAESADEGMIFDPFGGSGTTALAAATLGRESSFAEVNPYMAWIAEVKTNCARSVAETPGSMPLLRKLCGDIADGTLPPIDQFHPLLKVNEKRDYFTHDNARIVLGLLALIDKSIDGPAREIARLAVATSLVPASHMIRRTDLRRRIGSDPSPIDLRPTVVLRLREFIDDIEKFGSQIRAGTTRVAQDVRQRWSTSPDISVVVTSPPYLNGTNYCRNTKLELIALGFLDSEMKLKELRAASISAGINNVSKGRSTAPEIKHVEQVAKKLDKVAYDARIPTLVRTYFADMKLALAQTRRHTRTGSRMYLDIGDSRYCGVHVPTHRILTAVAEDEKWCLVEEQVIRTRRSYDGNELTQVLLQFEAR